MRISIQQLIMMLTILFTQEGCVSYQTLAVEQLKGPIVKVSLKKLAQNQAQACTQIKPFRVPTTDYTVAAQESGILADDFLSLHQTIAKQHATVTIRDVNKSCTPHLRAGIASKGHDVLTKTFIAESLPAEYQYLAGTVSTLSIKPKPGVKLKDPLAMRYLTRDGNPLTCDYDLMDVAQANGQRIEGESAYDLQLRAMLNKNLPWRGQPPRPAMRIMHGAQAEYSTYLRTIDAEGKPAEEPLTWLNQPEAPLTGFSYNGEVYRLQHIEDALNFYRCHNIALPAEWNISIN